MVDQTVGSTCLVGICKRDRILQIGLGRYQHKIFEGCDQTLEENQHTVMVQEERIKVSERLTEANTTKKSKIRMM